MFAPWVQRLAGDRSGWILSLLPLSLAVYFASFLPEVSRGEVIIQQWIWLPGMDINLSFLLDGLSLLFALLISFIGTFIIIYAGSYLKGHKDLGRFFVIMLSFMASMLGLVLSDNLISLFVFWELTSITSYMLIGFDHEDESARKSALQGLFVTVGGGLALMAGLIMLGTLGGSYQISELLNSGDALLTSSLSVGMIVLILIGCFTKSAQFPFHFWLPNAMAAPTPVSAYLHSATMVKAGIYLLARLNPALAEHWLWSASLSLFGAITMFVGAYLAYSATDVKKVLAYSTVMALGTLTVLIGIGTQYALIAFASFLLAHSMYKAALFMIAGVIDHEAGTKDLTRLGGLHKAMPVTAIAALIAALSLAGLPPLFGFIAKEALFEAVLSTELYSNLLLILALLSAMLVTAIAAVIAIKPFYGELKTTPKAPHEGPLGMLAGPVVLASLSLLFGLMPFLPDSGILTATVNSISSEPFDFYLALWHGFNLPLLLSVISLLGGIALYHFWSGNRQHIGTLTRQLSRFGPEAGYFKFMDGIVFSADWQTRVLQNGKMGNYMIVMIMTTVILVGYTLLSQYGFRLTLQASDVAFYEWAIALLMVVSVLYAIQTRSRLGAVASMGVLGFTVALIFIHFSAPDLGITQVLVETLTVILLVLVLFKLPGFSRYSTRFEVIRDASVAISMGVLMTLLLLAAIDTQYFETISAFFLEASYPEAKGRNIVNVILVDFRALDTLGEIFVLAIAALGVYSMLKLRAEKNS
ncbi:monovalent cation/H+ antiporter subunit A [Methylophaga lonarensis MPL]|uniref:Monovalent cation/H+ antiporter subunit A n=2 Tax=Methylophaga lonarensis TaxID=999151 RepID=M7PIY9_9GAMM|nr:monovalent cation/H+ antiporter subunit A [Methylophaga lonarensis MPL]